MEQIVAESSLILPLDIYSLDIHIIVNNFNIQIVVNANI